MHEDDSESGAAVNSGVGQGAGTDKCRRSEAGTKPALRDDPSGDVQSALAHCLPARWPHARHRKSRAGLAGDSAGREDADRQRAGGPASRAGRHAGRVRIAALRKRPQRVPHLCGTGRRWIEPGARTGAAGHRHEHGEPRRIAGAVAKYAQGPRRTVRRRDRIFSGRAVPLSDRRRPAAHDTRTGSGPATWQDPAPDARRQARAGQSNGRKDRGGDYVADQPSTRHGTGQDRARDQHVYVPGTKPDAERDLDDGSPDTLRSGVRARRPAMGD